MLRPFALLLILAGSILGQQQPPISRFSDLAKSELGFSPHIPTNLNSIDIDLPAIALTTGDSVFFRAGNMVGLTCEGCPPFIQSDTLFSFAIPKIYRGLPLQKMVQIFSFYPNPRSEPTSIHFLAADSNRVLYWSYQWSDTLVKDPQQPYSPPPPTFSDSITLPIGPHQIIYGIDGFTADSIEIHFEIFGSGGLRAQVSASLSGMLLDYRYLGFADSLDLTASAPGFYGTLHGQILDSSLGWNPIHIGNQPVSLVDSTGAVGDSGMFALKSQGVWRPFPQPADNLRDFAIELMGFNDWGYWAYWGTHATLWNDHDSSYDHFIKDDSTVWVNVSTSPPQTFSKDSILVFHSTPDSITLNLFDSDLNYTLPNISWISNGNRAFSWSSTWKNFSPGCVGIDTVSCFYYRGPSAPLISLRWDQDSVYLRSSLLRGTWQERAYWGDYDILNYAYFYISFDSTADTTLHWSQGDTVRVQFWNAAFSLVHAEPVAVAPATTSSPLRVRLLAREIQWQRPGATTGTTWEIRDLRGRPVLQGTDQGTDGNIRFDRLPPGVFELIFTDAATHHFLWQGPITAI